MNLDWLRSLAEIRYGYLPSAVDLFISVGF
jgi:hypothetical protein